jgi:hypothetical protein
MNTDVEYAQRQENPAKCQNLSETFDQFCRSTPEQCVKAGATDQIELVDVHAPTWMHGSLVRRAHPSRHRPKWSRVHGRDRARSAHQFRNLSIVSVRPLLRAPAGVRHAPAQDSWDGWPLAEDEGYVPDLGKEDVGIDGGAVSAEEAAVHIVEP